MKIKLITLSLLGVMVSLAAIAAETDAPKPKSGHVAKETLVSKEAVVDLSAKLFTIPGTEKINMVRIPAGTFVMGSPANEVGRRDDEVRHTVTISKPFYMGETEISQKQFMSLMRPNFKPVFFNNGPWGHSLSEIHQGGPWKAKSRYNRNPVNDPMENVTWKQAMKFCKLLTDMEAKAGRLPAGYEYRLPTEAEWEYTCRAGTTGSFNHPNVAERAKEKRGLGVSVFGNNYPNAFGLFRMHMGVFEWCLDDYAPYRAGSKTDPVTLVKGQGARKVARGGDEGYALHPASRDKKLTEPKDIYRYIRSASRCNFPAGIPLPIVGLRPVLAPKIDVPEPVVPEKVSLEPLPKEQAQP